MEEEHIFTSSYPDLPVFPEANFISNLFQDWEKYSDLTALVCGYTEHELTYKELQQQIEKWCGYFSAKHPKKTIICMISPNTVEAAVCIMGMMAAGMIFTGISGGTDVDDIVARLDSMNICDVIIHKSHQKTMEEAIEKTGRKFSKILIGCDEPMENEITYNDVLNDDKINQRKPVEVDIDDIICIIYSSGSTGLPKAMLISHKSFNHGCQSFRNPPWNHLGYTTENHQAVCYASERLNHTFGLFWVLLCGLQLGQKVIVKTINMEKVVDEMEHFKVTRLHSRPGVLAVLLKNSEGRRSALKSVQSIWVTGGRLTSSLISDFKKVFPEIKVQNTYSLSESMGIAMTTIYDEDSSAPQAIMNSVKIKVRDLETGKSLPANCKGEILFINDAVFSGYLNNPEANSKSKTEDGWYCTGDVGMVDENNRITIIDRIKEMIKTAFKTVHPAELENVLMTHPGVDGACVVGVPHPEYLETPRAFVVLKDSSVTKETLHQLVADKLPETYKLNGGIIFLDALPFMPSGKVDRVGLKKYEV